MVNCCTFKIGNMPGQYPAGTKIIDTIFSRGIVAYVVIDSVPNNVDFVQDSAMRTLDFSPLGSLTNGSTVTVNFEKTINS
jgi:hypothetical protein